jgi:hypothetical protein
VPRIKHGKGNGFVGGIGGSTTASSATDTFDKLAPALNSSAANVAPSQPIDLVFLKPDSDMEVREILPVAGCRLPVAGCHLGVLL